MWNCLRLVKWDVVRTQHIAFFFFDHNSVMFVCTCAAGRPPRLLFSGIGAAARQPPGAVVTGATVLTEQLLRPMCHCHTCSMWPCVD